MEQVKDATAAVEHRDPDARTKRIFARLREGWAYDDIAKDERISAERVRQIVGQVLENRVLDRGDDHAHMQIERLGRRCGSSAKRWLTATSRPSAR